MKKYVSVLVEVERECAYCTYKCDYIGTGYCKWGQIEIWSCPKHGEFKLIDGPMRLRGDQLR